MPRPRADFAEIKKTAVYDSKFGPKEVMCKILKNFVTRSSSYAPNGRTDGRTDERTEVFQEVLADLKTVQEELHMLLLNTNSSNTEISIPSPAHGKTGCLYTHVLPRPGDFDPCPALPRPTPQEKTLLRPSLHPGKDHIIL